MKKDRRIVGLRGQQGIVSARFLAVVFLFVSACFYGVLRVTGIVQGVPIVCRSMGQEIVKKAYDTRAAFLGVVKIMCGDFRGSGVVIARDADGVVIVSAKHLLMYDVQAKVSFAGTESGESVTGDVIGYSASYDLAYLYVPQSAIPLDAAHKQSWDVSYDASDASWTVEEDEKGQKVVVRTDEACQKLQAGDSILQIGLSETSELVCYTGTVQAKEVFISDYNASMLLMECEAVAGMSGGGAFDKSGHLVGIIIAGDAQGAICMPMTTVLDEYRELAR